MFVFQRCPTSAQLEKTKVEARGKMNARVEKLEASNR
jgi:hypothetical protein